MPPPFDPLAAETTLFAALLDASRAHGGGKVVIRDADRTELSYRRLVLGSLVLGRALIAGTRPGETVAVMLPNTAALVVTLFGLNAFNRTVAALNFTAGSRNLSAAVRTAPARVLITSRRFVEMAKLDDVVADLAKTEVAPGKPLEIRYLEDVRAGIGGLAKAIGFVSAFFARPLHRATGAAAHKPAVVLFTSGTEGTPKGVVLTNRNIVANTQQIFAHAEGALSPADIVVNPLPMFHSFGLTAGTLMPLLNGLATVLYPSPLQYRQVAALVRTAQATVMFATDTFLQGYARAADPGDLATIRFVIAGAERVKDHTRALWGTTGALVLEGYGATECAPVLAVNLPDDNRPGTVGRLLPGIETRLEPVAGIAEGGKLIVRGPNVMAGYLMLDHPGVLVPPADGWYDTGDIVTIIDGFVTIRGRAKRFAKIGGEMVSLAAVETLAAGLWPNAQHVVVALPDPRRGEQLILVTDKADADKDALLAEARRAGFPELWVPKAILVVGALPVMGSGKVDLPATLEMVRQTRALL